MNGLGRHAAAYHAELLAAVARAMRDQMKSNGELSSADCFAAGLVPSQNYFSQFVDEMLTEALQYFDDISGKPLPAGLVAEAHRVL